VTWCGARSAWPPPCGRPMPCPLLATPARPCRRLVLVGARPRVACCAGPAAAVQVIGTVICPLDAAKVAPDGRRTMSGFRSSHLSGEEAAKTLACDSGLVAMAERVAAQLTATGALPRWPGRRGSGAAARPAVHRGVVGSSDTWTQHRPSIAQLHELHGTICEEMESQAICSVCASFGVPFLAVKDISNNELRDDTTDSLFKVVSSAAVTCLDKQ
jgi:nucleoside phosphorylase